MNVKNKRELILNSFIAALKLINFFTSSKRNVNVHFYARVCLKSIKPFKSIRTLSTTREKIERIIYYIIEVLNQYIA